jgi:hypothetical protein
MNYPRVSCEHVVQVFASLWELVAHYSDRDRAAPISDKRAAPVRLKFQFSSYASNPWYHGAHNPH